MTDKRHTGMGMHDMPDAAPPIPRGKIRRRGAIVILIVLLLLALGGARTVAMRVVHAQTLDQATAEQTQQNVVTIFAQQGQAQQTLQLPGTLLGAIESPIYARANGYLLHWYKDIGAPVKKGDLLAEIETPELDQQLSQSKAARDQSAASLELAHTSYDRWHELRGKDVVSQQELDERQGAYAQAQANVSAASADVRRLEQLTGFKRVLAPFDGVITRRNIDVGDLVNAGNGGAGSALFSESQIDRLRLYVYVPQAYAQLVRAGQQVTVLQSELPGQQFTGTIARTAGAIDQATRTLQIEVSLENEDHKLLPGAFVQVALHTSATPALTVPTNTLLFRGDGTHVATVDDGGKVGMPIVTIGRDFGTRVEILAGITATDHLIVNPPDSIAAGDRVVAKQAPTPPTSQPNDNKSAHAQKS